MIFDQIAASFQLYEPDVVNDTTIVNKLKSRIVTIIDDPNIIHPYALFAPNLSFKSILFNYYSAYQQIILHPKVIEITVYLSDLEIYQLDLMTPVYLEQTGNHYIILELQVNANNTAKAKLIQM